MFHHRKIMRNKEIRNSGLRLDILKQIDDLRLNTDIQC